MHQCHDSLRGNLEQDEDGMAFGDRGTFFVAFTAAAAVAAPTTRVLHRHEASCERENHVLTERGDLLLQLFFRIG